jgi:hypothetical protein
MLEPENPIADDILSVLKSGSEGEMSEQFDI